MNKRGIGMADKFRYSKDPVDDDVRRFQRETEDNFLSYDKDGNLVIDKDIRCRSLYVEGESIYIGGIKVKSPIHSDNDGYWKYNRTKKQFELTAGSIDEDNILANQVFS